MPSSIKGKLKEHYDKTIEQKDNSFGMHNIIQPAKPVNFDRAQRSSPTQYKNKNNYYNYNGNYQHHQQNFNHINNNYNLKST